MTTITSTTLITTIDAALETAQIVNRILADKTLTYGQRHKLIDDVFAHAQEAQDE